MPVLEYFILGTRGKQSGVPELDQERFKNKLSTPSRSEAARCPCKD